MYFVPELTDGQNCRTVVNADDVNVWKRERNLQCRVQRTCDHNKT